MDEFENNSHSVQPGQSALDLRVDRAGWEKARLQASAAKKEREKLGQEEAFALLRQKDAPAERVYLKLVDVAEQLGCKPDDLLDKGVAGKLDVYAPVLLEGLYAWPVTNRGIPHASLVGSIDGVEPVFRARLQYGEYALLLPADIKKIKVEQSVKPSGYICPELVMRHTAEWQQEQQQAGRAAMLAERMKNRANSVAWIFAHPRTTDAGVVRLEMLRVDSGDVQRLLEQSSSLYEAQDAHGTNELPERLPLGDKKNDSVSTVVRNQIAEYPFRGEMSSAIANAVHAAVDPESFHSVWEELLKLAEAKMAPLLSVNEEGKIRFRNREGKTNVYEKSSLEKSLGRAVKAVKSSCKTP
ncbi:hypothetical protein AB4Y44_01370 [Paraburkholderia sp. BR10937]|uniref:hypothetical protein n=1 Tax=Paraburkholderia sp. BR10937 TaxID=3236994 RepID=UPI0034D2EDA3